MINMYEYYKCKLNIRAKQIYEGILKNIDKLAFFGFVELQVMYDNFIMQDAKMAYRALRLDRPEYYFLGHNIRIKCNTVGLLTIQHNMKYSKNHILRMNRLLKQTVKELISGTEGLSIVDKEKIIYCNVGKAFSYREGKYAHDLSGLLVYKNGVCEALSGMLVVAFREAGIPAIVVQGYARNEGHRWCKVWIDNKEYYVDVTWDMNNCKLGLELKYFNLTYNKMSRDHQLVDVFTNEFIMM